MKTRTKAVAWLYIILHLIAFVAGAVGVFWAIVFPDSFAESAKGYIPHFDKFSSNQTLAIGFAAAFFAVLLASLIVWVCLLKKHGWAWWTLMGFFCLAALDVVVGLLGQISVGFDQLGSDIVSGHAGKIYLLIPYLVTLLFLRTDQPSSWRKKTVRRRRRSRAVSARRTTKTRTATSARTRTRSSRRR